MICVVTGAAGFIGSSLCDALLEAGHVVKGLDSFADYYPRQAKELNLSRAKEYRQFSLIEDDLVKLDLVELLGDVEVVFHLAAQAGVRTSWGDEFRTYSDSNIVATQRLLEACRITRPRRIVYASSSSVYGNAADLPVREDAVLHPVSPYGVSKLAAEHLCALYHWNFGLQTIGLRYFTVFGPRQRPDMAFHRFLKAGLEGSPIRIFGDGNQTRDFTYIADVVAVTQSASKNGKVGDVYNVGGGAIWKVADVLSAIEEVVGSRLRIQRLPSQPGDVRDTHADTTKARRELAFQPATTVTEGLANEAAWLKERLAGTLSTPGAH